MDEFEVVEHTKPRSDAADAKEGQPTIGATEIKVKTYCDDGSERVSVVQVPPGAACDVVLHIRNGEVCMASNDPRDEETKPKALVPESKVGETPPLSGNEVTAMMKAMPFPDASTNQETVPITPAKVDETPPATPAANEAARATTLLEVLLRRYHTLLTNWTTEPQGIRAKVLVSHLEKVTAFVQVAGTTGVRLDAVERALVGDLQTLLAKSSVWSKAIYNKDNPERLTRRDVAWHVTLLIKALMAL